MPEKGTIEYYELVTNPEKAFLKIVTRNCRLSLAFRL